MVPNTLRDLISVMFREVMSSMRWESSWKTVDSTTCGIMSRIWGSITPAATR